MFCRDKDGNLVQLGAGAYGQVRHGAPPPPCASSQSPLPPLQPGCLNMCPHLFDLPTKSAWKRLPSSPPTLPPHPTPPLMPALDPPCPLRPPPHPLCGQVYKAFLHGVHPVAVKVFQTQDDVPLADFWKEAAILRSCRHRSIVQLQGACVDGDTTMMVTELMDTDLYRALQVSVPLCCASFLLRALLPPLAAQASHQRLLHHLLVAELATPPLLPRQANRVSWYRHGHDIAIDIAQALHFLHSRSIIHFDCKSPNILLSADNKAKLAGKRLLPPSKAHFPCVPEAECLVVICPGRRHAATWTICGWLHRWHISSGSYRPSLPAPRGTSHAALSRSASALALPNLCGYGSHFWASLPHPKVESFSCTSNPLCPWPCRCGLGADSVPLLHHRRRRHLQLGGEQPCCPPERAAVLPAGRQTCGPSSTAQLPSPCPG